MHLFPLLVICFLQVYLDSVVFFKSFITLLPCLNLALPGSKFFFFLFFFKANSKILNWTQSAPWASLCFSLEDAFIPRTLCSWPATLLLGLPSVTLYASLSYPILWTVHTHLSPKSQSKCGCLEKLCLSLRAAGPTASWCTKLSPHTSYSCCIIFTCVMTDK